jgi:DNA-binding response OmpR family regulator
MQDDVPADSSALSVPADADERAAPAVVLLQGIEPAVADLYGAWLSLDGLRVQRSAAAGEAVALILVDIPFPRQDGAARLRRLGAAWPGVPLLVLSPTFLPGVVADGEVARQLGAAAALATPVACDTLRSTVARLLLRGPLP